MKSKRPNRVPTKFILRIFNLLFCIRRGRGFRYRDIIVEREKIFGKGEKENDMVGKKKERLGGERDLAKKTG